MKGLAAMRLVLYAYYGLIINRYSCCGVDSVVPGVKRYPNR